MHILLATDAQWILNEIVAVLGTPSTSFTVVSDGRDVSAAVKTHTPDLAILDLQSGSMGAMAVAMNLRLDHSSGNAPMVPVLMLLDRVADVHLARRSGADGWIIKPLDALRLRRAVTMVLDGDVYQEGLPTNADVLTNQ
ncbi:MAG: response regulator transcription factor [Ilumatobacteraceae bacterium]|nr:response regulator transcription factor [Ilumatobacteraceae bacterium]MBJ7366833.1 response regulator transcription factor [Ilumatobacteraceae bacterium]MBJ7486791.1 response regulator transcription factor [Ilumatobacteraceae bacterium]